MSLVSDPCEAPEDTEQDVLISGAVIQGKYLVHRVIGRGGMCIVGSATHIGLDYLVALKVLRRSLSLNPEAVLRFMREARSAARLKSEHAAHVFDVSVLDTGEPFMVMEHLEGQDLGAALASRGPFCTVEAVECILQACEAIGEAHASGIVHRDLKPANLFLTLRADGEPQVKVLDFGIATAVSGLDREPEAELPLTRGSTTFGTPPYMAPEQLCDPRDVDERSDIYALGVTLYELISGRVPFEGQSGAEVYGAALTQRPVPLNELDPRVPVALAAVVARCLAWRRMDRYANVSDLVAALIPFGPVRAEQYAQRVARIIDCRRPPLTGEPRVDPGAATLNGGSTSAPRANPAGDKANPPGRKRARRASDRRRPRKPGVGSVLAAVAAITLVLTSAAGGVVDSRATNAVQYALVAPAASGPASGSASGSASVRATVAESCPSSLNCAVFPLPASAPSSASPAPATVPKPPRDPRPRVPRPRAFNPYAERK